MKLVASVALSAFFASTTAFTSPAFVFRSSPAVSFQQSTLLEDLPTTTFLTEEAPKKMGPPPATRFDRFKKLYRGPRFELSDNEEIPFSYDDFDKAVQNTEYSFSRNTVVKGIAVEYTGGGCLVDIGSKASAFLPAQEAGLIMDGIDLSEAVPLEQPMDFQIISEEDENGQLLVSLKRLQYKLAWEKIAQMAADDAVFEATVVAVNRGGAICLVEGLRAFLPGSHLSGQLPDEELVGHKLKLKFLEVNVETNKLVVSNRKAVVEQQMSDLSRGDLVTGVVKALKPYGAFVDVGGMSGLLHISQISYDRIENLESVLQLGMEVKCMIIDHDKVNGRIALSTKTLEPQAGDMLKDSAAVFAKAEETAAAYHAKMEKERLAREEAARDMVLGLGDSLGDLAATSSDDDDDDATVAANDPLKDVSDSLDSLLS